MYEIKAIYYGGEYGQSEFLILVSDNEKKETCLKEGVTVDISTMTGSPLYYVIKSKYYSGEDQFTESYVLKSKMSDQHGSPRYSNLKVGMFITNMGII